MILIIECIMLCLIMWLICFLSTGTDEKNLVGLRSYPIEVQKLVSNSEKYKDKIKPTNMINVFLSNLFIFVIVLFILGIFNKSNEFKTNFINVFILGEILNLFDFVIIDMIWWRKTTRIRFQDIPEKKAYQNPKQHIDSFIRGVFMYLLVAVIDGILLTVI